MTVYICSPGLDQAQYIAHQIAAAQPDRIIVGVFMEGENMGRVHTVFTRTAVWTDLNQTERRACIPTGAHSTAARLELGDIALGDATMIVDALRFYSKPWSIEVAGQAGIPVPRTWLQPGEIADFPVFYKSVREGDGQRGIASSPTQLPDDLARVLLYQEYIDSPGTYGVGFISRDGVIRASHSHFESSSYPPVGGSAIIVEKVDDSRLLAHTERLLQATSFSGWGLVEFKYCPRRNDYVFMELNAKFWASCELAFRNEPLFGRILLNARPSDAPVDRLVFLHRAFARGGGFVLAHFGELLRGPIRTSFAQSIKPFVRAFTPRWALDLIRRNKPRKMPSVQPNRD